jgi:hypothetical protein
VRQEASHRISAFSVWKGKSLSFEVVSSNFPIQREPSIRAGTGGRRSQHLGGGLTLGVSNLSVTYVVDLRSAKSQGDVAAWVPGSEWSPGGTGLEDRRIGTRGWRVKLLTS